MARKIASIALLLASPASAQTHTNCMWMGSTLSCTSTGTPSGGGVDWGAYNRAQAEQVQRNQEIFNNFISQLLVRRQANAAANQFQMQQEALSWAERVRGEVGERLAKGDCVGAQNFALTNGQTDLAKQAKAYCASSPPPAK